MSSRIVNTYDYRVCGNCLCAYFNGLDSIDEVSESTVSWIREYYNGYTLDCPDLENAHFTDCSICNEVSDVVDCTLIEWV